MHAQAAAVLYYRSPLYREERYPLLVLLPLAHQIQVHKTTWSEALVLARLNWFAILAVELNLVALMSQVLSHTLSRQCRLSKAHIPRKVRQMCSLVADATVAVHVADVTAAAHLLHFLLSLKCQTAGSFKER